MLNCFSGVFVLTNSQKVDGDLLFIVGKAGEDLPTLCFGGRQRETIEKWGKPGRVVAISGALRTKIVGNQKMTYVDVAYSRFVDKVETAEVAAPKAAAPAVVAKSAPKAAAKPAAKPAAKKATASAPPADNDDMPF